MELLITMGIPRKDNKAGEGHRYGKAVMQVVDWENKKLKQEITYEPPAGNIGAGLSRQYKGGCIYKRKFYVVTNTEVLIYSTTDWSLQNTITLKSFNDLHGVFVDDDRICVCNTGLEIVQVFDHNFELVEEINLASTPTYERFDKELDYRMVPTTKPHEVHINHIFGLNGERWVTRGLQADAVNLHDTKACFDLKDGNSENGTAVCHDGLVRGERIYFTTVDGHIVVFDINNRKKILDIDVNQVAGNLGRSLGWVRGLEIVDNKAFLGTTKMRSSIFKEYTKWIVCGEERKMPSSIIEIDLDEHKVLDFYEMEGYEGHAIYNIIKT